MYYTIIISSFAFLWSHGHNCDRDRFLPKLVVYSDGLFTSNTCPHDRTHARKIANLFAFSLAYSYLCNRNHINNRIMEARTTMYPQEGQLLVSISDMSMMKDIKKAIGMLKGVGNVTVPRRKRISAYERSLQELEEGRVYEAKDVDDLFKQCLG